MTASWSAICSPAPLARTWKPDDGQCRPGASVLRRVAGQRESERPRIRLTPEKQGLRATNVWFTFCVQLHHGNCTTDLLRCASRLTCSHDVAIAAVVRVAIEPLPCMRQEHVEERARVLLQGVWRFHPLIRRQFDEPPCRISNGCRHPGRQSPSGTPPGVFGAVLPVENRCSV